VFHVSHFDNLIKPQINSAIQRKTSQNKIKNLKEPFRKRADVEDSGIERGNRQRS